MNVTMVAQDVLALLASEGVCLSDDLTQVERLIRDMVHRVGAKAVEVHLGNYNGSGKL